MGRPGAASSLVRALSHIGLALLDGVPDADSLLDVARSIASVVPHRDSRPDGVTVLADRGAPAACGGFAGFGRQELIPHTDRSSIDRPVQYRMPAGTADDGLWRASRVGR